MPKSLRIQLFLQALVCLAVIVEGNRLLSRYVAQAYVAHRVDQGMATVLRQCQGLSANEPRLQACAADATAGSLLESLSLHLLSCPEIFSPDQGSALCAQLAPVALPRQVLAPEDASGPQQSEAMLDGQVWLVFRSQDGADAMLLKKSNLDAFGANMWDIRDRVFLYVVPLLVLAMAFLTWFVIRQLMHPLNQVRDALTRLSSSNLDQPIGIDKPHREFVSLLAAMEELQARLHASFQQSQRFSADASHELRTPLTILRGHVEQAIAEAPTGSQGQIRLCVMEEEVGRLVDVTEKLLLLSRADAQAIRLERIQLDFSNFLNELVNDAAQFETDLRIGAQVEADIFWHCDTLLVRQLVLNLYTNAVNYNLDQGWIHFKATQSEGWLLLSLENPTRHFSPELSQKAFDRFYRGSASRSRHMPGQGLGLSLCREIAHLHGGTLTLSANDQHHVSALLRVPLQS